MKFILFIAAFATTFLLFEAMESQLKKPLDQPSKKIIEDTVDEFLNDKVFDMVWKSTFHALTLLESLDGWDDASTGTGVVTLSTSGDEVQISTGATSGGVGRIRKLPNKQGLLTFNQRSNFRTAFQLDVITSEIAYMTVGNSEGPNAYGFKVSAGSLYGVTLDNNANENAVLLQSISANTTYNVEARYIPGNEPNTTGKVVFITGGDLVGPTEKGISIVNLPVTSQTVNPNLFDLRITSSATGARILKVSFMEYLQRRNILK